MEVRILTTNLESFIPHQAMNSEFRFPVELNEMTFSFRIDERERVDAEPLHHPERSWDSSITHDPKDCVGGLRLEGEEVPKVVVS